MIGIGMVSSSAMPRKIQPAKNFPSDGVGGVDWHGEEQFEGAWRRALTTGACPQPAPAACTARVPDEEAGECRLFEAEETAHHKGEEAHEEQEDDSKNVGYRRVEVTGQLPLGDDPDIFHAYSFALSRLVMREYFVQAPGFRVEFVKLPALAVQKRL